jgi:plastocyanin
MNTGMSRLEFERSTMSRLRLLAGVGLVGALVAGALQTADAAPLRTNSQEGAALAAFKIDVAESGFSYSPKTAHVNKGRKVKWTNKGSQTHTVTFYKKPKGTTIKSFSLGVGESRKRTVKKVGVYKYRCLVATHSSLNDGKCSGMCGKVRAH